MSVEDALREFELALDEVKDNLDFIRASSKLRPRLNQLLNWEYMDADAKSLAKQFLKLRTDGVGSQYRGFVVVISGAFEHLVRRLVEETIRSFGGTGGLFDSVPECVRTQNAIRTGRALVKHKEPLDHAPLDYQILVERLATCRSGAATFSLNAEVFSYFVSNITPGHLEEIFGWVDITISWDTFGGLAEFESQFGTAGPRATGKQVVKYLQMFTKLRNRIAHVGAGGVVVSDNEIVEQILFFRVFSKHLGGLVNARIQDM